MVLSKPAIRFNGQPMKAMILAAGRGERMRPLTDHTPKPLLIVGGEPLIVWHIKRLSQAGFTQIVINHAWLGAQIEQTLGDGAKWNVSIVYSPEREGGLETAGGIATALSLLGQEPFLVVNGDIFTDMDFAHLRHQGDRLKQEQLLAHLVLTAFNPEHHPKGDFALTSEGYATDETSEYCPNRFTFSGVGVYHPDLFRHTKAHEKAKLAPLLRTAMGQRQVSAEKHSGIWLDVGTAERLALADELAKTRTDW